MSGVLQVDAGIVEKLREASLGDLEGSSFNFSGPDKFVENTAQKEQLRFKEECLKKYSPRVLLETGTNKAHFCYLCKLVLPQCTIFTFDINYWSADCAQVINNHFKDGEVIFKEGCTQVTLPSFDPSLPIDFAHIDGGHDYYTALFDLGQCHRLSIPVILVDDWRSPHCKKVRKAVHDFCQHFPYSVVEENSAILDPYRGLVILERSDATFPKPS